MSDASKVHVCEMFPPIMQATQIGKIEPAKEGATSQYIYEPAT